MLPFKEGSLLPTPETPIIGQMGTENDGNDETENGGLNPSNGESPGQLGEAE